MSNLDASYSNKLKEKITIQAKRLTKLESEKEELLDLLHEKNMSQESSFSSCFLSNGKQSFKGKSSKSQMSKIFENELEKYKNELLKAKDKIKELQHNKDNMITFKDQITEHLSYTTIDVEKTKKNLNELQSERAELNFKITELEETNKLIAKALKDKDNLLISLEESIKTLREEKIDLSNKAKRYEASNIKLQKENCELAMQSSDSEKHKLESTYLINESNQLKQFNERNEKELKQLTDKLRSSIQENKKLSNQLKKTINDNCCLNRDITELKLSNGAFAQTIDSLTNKLEKFQEKVENDINKTLKLSTNIEIEQKTKEFMYALETKDNEIYKLKELMKNYFLLEQEMSKSMKEKDDQIYKLKGKYEAISAAYSKLKHENNECFNKIKQMTIDNEAYIKENEKLKAGYENMNNQYQNTVKMKNMQIGNLKSFSELLGEKIIIQEKNKNYYEHLLLKTHPNSTIVREILELYAEIVGLENEKKKFDQENNNDEDGTEKEMDKKRISNIEQQIDCLKENLKMLEKEIYIQNINHTS